MTGSQYLAGLLEDKPYRHGMNTKLCLCMLAHDDHTFLAESLRSFNDVDKRFVFVSTKPWHGEPGDCQRTAEIARSAGAEVVEGEWTDELSHRKAAYSHAQSLVRPW